MKNRLAIGLMVGLVTLVLGTSAVWAEKLICISKEQLRGEETVENCLRRGEKFAVMDEHGVIRILTKEEIDLMKKVNPKIFQMPAYGILYEKEAPPLPKLPHHAIPKKYQ